MRSSSTATASHTQINYRTKRPWLQFRQKMEETKIKEETTMEDVTSTLSNAVVEKPNFSVDVVNVNVSGIAYELERDDIRRAPSSRLYKYAIIGKMTTMVFKRPIQSFEAVLAYYQTGELHMPLSVCPGAFKTELMFWGLDPQIMTKCCYYRYLSHLEDQETLDRFHKHLFPEVGTEKSASRYMKTVRNKLWTILDNIDNKIITKIYFYIVMAMVILSVMTLSLSTLAYFRRGLTKCELEELYGKPLKSTNSSISSNDSCSDPLPDSAYTTLFVDYEKLNITDISEINDNDVVKEIRNKNTPDDQTDDTEDSMTDNQANSSKARINNRMFSGLFDEEDEITDKALVDHIFETLRPKIGIAKKTVRIRSLVLIDTALLAFFTADLLLRVACCPSLKCYFTSTINIIDALVVLAAYAHMLINTLKTSEKYETSYFDILEIFQVLRVVRLLRVVRNVTGFKVLTFSIKVSIKDLVVLFLYLMLGIAIFANFIYFVESEDGKIASIPLGWWWAINTLTTVGYGDLYPVTLYGRMIGGLCAIFGVVMMAVAIPVFVKTFLLLYAYAALYKKSINKPEDTNRYIHRQGVLNNMYHN